MAKKKTEKEVSEPTPTPPGQDPSTIVTTDEIPLGTSSTDVVEEVPQADPTPLLARIQQLEAENVKLKTSIRKKNEEDCAEAIEQILIKHNCVMAHIPDQPGMWMITQKE